MVIGTVTKLRTGRSGVQISGGAGDLYLLQNVHTDCRNYPQLPSLMRDFRLPPRSKRELRFSGLLTQRIEVIPYRPFGTAYLFRLRGSTLR